MVVLDPPGNPRRGFFNTKDTALFVSFITRFLLVVRRMVFFNKRNASSALCSCSYSIDFGLHTLMSSMAWVKRCYSEKSKNLNKLLVFEALYP